MAATPVQTYGPAAPPPTLVTGAVGPQTSTASTVVVAGSEIDATQFGIVSYTAKGAAQSVDWSVFGANNSNYSDEVVVLAAATILAGASASYAVAPAPYRFYRVKVIDTSGGTHGTITVNGAAKAY